MRSNSEKRYLIGLVIILSMIGLQCREPYVYPVSATETNYLHIEGSINTSGDTTLITLTRTVKLTDSARSKPELNALVTVEVQNGGSYQLLETGKGKYVYPNLSFLNQGQQCKLNITTSDGKKYSSDFVPVKNSPPIDSIYYEVTADGVQIYSDTHDPANNSRYYRWDFDDTWSLYSFYDSHFKVQTSPSNDVVLRETEDQIDSCWQNGASSSLILNSSARLSQDVITRNPVALINESSEKLRGGYSLLLHQHVLTKEAFEYWQNLKKNTEQLGSIFDAQPSQLQGNFHCISKPSEMVLGYLSAGVDAKKRIMIRRSSISSWKALPLMTGCRLDTLYLADLPRLFNSTAIPIQGVYNTHVVLIGYSITPIVECADCRLRGTNKPPAFWK